eukprot:13745500-Heterocapsa_arctica.AAC.1
MHLHHLHLLLEHAHHLHIRVDVVQRLAAHLIFIRPSSCRSTRAHSRRRIRPSPPAYSSRACAHLPIRRVVGRGLQRRQIHHLLSSISLRDRSDHLSRTRPLDLQVVLVLRLAILVDHHSCSRTSRRDIWPGLLLKYS